MLTVWPPRTTDAPEEEPARAIQLVRKKVTAPNLSGQYAAVLRKFARTAYITPVTVVDATGIELDSRSEEISEEGMLVLTPTALPTGSSVRVRFAAPGRGDMVTAAATVRWTREGRGRHAQGLEFVNVPADLRTVIADYIAAQAAARA